MSAERLLSARQLRAIRPEHRPLVEELARAIAVEIERMLEAELRRLELRYPSLSAVPLSAER